MMPFRLKALRLPEVLLMTGFFIIGSVFGMGEINAKVLKDFFLIGLASFFFVLSVYTNNTLAGVKTDKLNHRLHKLQGISPETFRLFTYLSLFLSISFSAIINPAFAATYMVLFLLWFAYSHPVFGLKHKPYWGTVLHFFAQIIHFNLCYAVFSPIGISSILISVYYALAFSIGHLNHEIVDYEADKKASSTTTAVKHGTKRVLGVSILLCVFNIVLLCFLYYSDFIKSATFALMIIPVMIHLLLYVRFAGNFLFMAKQLRTYYRLSYFVFTLLLTAIKAAEFL